MTFEFLLWCLALQRYSIGSLTYEAGLEIQAIFTFYKLNARELSYVVKGIHAKYLGRYIGIKDRISSCI